MGDNKKDFGTAYFYHNELCVIEITESLKDLFLLNIKNKSNIEEIIYLEKPKFLNDNIEINYEINYEQFHLRRLKDKYKEINIPSKIQHKRIPEESSDFFKKFD